MLAKDMMGLWSILDKVNTAEIPAAAEAMVVLWEAYEAGPQFTAEWFVNVGDAVAGAIAAAVEVSTTEEDDMVIDRFTRAWPHFRIGILAAIGDGEPIIGSGK